MQARAPALGAGAQAGVDSAGEVIVLNATDGGRAIEMTNWVTWIDGGVQQERNLANISFVVLDASGQPFLRVSRHAAHLEALRICLEQSGGGSRMGPVRRPMAVLRSFMQAATQEWLRQSMLPFNRCPSSELVTLPLKHCPSSELVTLEGSSALEGRWVLTYALSPCSGLSTAAATGLAIERDRLVISPSPTAYVAFSRLLCGERGACAGSSNTSGEVGDLLRGEFGSGVGMLLRARERSVAASGKGLIANVQHQEEGQEPIPLAMLVWNPPPIPPNAVLQNIKDKEEKQATLDPDAPRDVEVEADEEKGAATAVPLCSDIGDDHRGVFGKPTVGFADAIDAAVAPTISDVVAKELQLSPNLAAERRDGRVLYGVCQSVEAEWSTGVSPSDGRKLEVRCMCVWTTCVQGWEFGPAMLRWLSSNESVMTNSPERVADPCFPSGNGMYVYDKRDRIFGFLLSGRVCGLLLSSDASDRLLREAPMCRSALSSFTRVVKDILQVPEAPGPIVPSAKLTPNKGCLLAAGWSGLYLCHTSCIPLMN